MKFRGVYIAIVVAALGYFVDIYDLILFGVVRISSLNSLGIIEANEVRINGEYLMNTQMTGLLIGGFIWGILGDKRGRLSVLFGSIFLYSVANLANGFVNSIEMYAVLRLIAGIGLAGELGAGVTLVSELMSKEKRGIGTTIIASFGLLGAVAANRVANLNLEIGLESWRIAYIVGGVMGLGLLALRFGVRESGMFSSLEAKKVHKGSLIIFIKGKQTFYKYLNCVLIGVPLWFVIGILVFQSPEFATSLELGFNVDAGFAIMLAYMGLSAGDLASGLLSQLLKSRRKSVFIFLVMTSLFTAHYLTLDPETTEFHFYILIFGLGFGVGYWAVFVTIAAEQFGTNVRATAATTIPNIVRGALVPSTLLFQFFRTKIWGGMAKSDLYGAGAVIIILMSVAFVSLYFLKETFEKDLDYVE
jgi:MFS family permease